MADGAVRKVVIPYAPRWAFMPFHERDQRFAALVCHRRAGKTVSSLNDVLKDVITCQLPAPRGAYIAPMLRQAKDIAWDYLKRYTDPIPGRQFNEAELRVDMPGDRRIRLYGADNPDSLRGIYLDSVLLDEPAQMKPAMWEEVVRPALADRRGRATFIGTPKGRNWFYKIWREAQKSPDWFTLMLKASQSGILSQDEVMSMTKDMAPAIIAQEMECSFEESATTQFIPAEVVDAARARVKGNGGALVMGVDVARFGDDRTVILVRNDALRHVRVMRGIDTMQTAALVAEEGAKWKPAATFVDGGGVGGGVVDRLRMLGHRVFDVNAGSKANDPGRYANKRVEMYGIMRDWLRDRGCIPVGVDHIAELADDLVSPQYKYDSGGRLLLESKDDMKARGMPSPDLGDALALTFAEPVASPDMLAVAWQQRGQHDDYDPLTY